MGTGSILDCLSIGPRIDSSPWLGHWFTLDSCFNHLRLIDVVVFQEKFEKKEVVYDQKGRPGRDSAGKVRYDLMLEDEENDNADNIEAWAAAVVQMNSPPKYVGFCF